MGWASSPSSVGRDLPVCCHILRSILVGRSIDPALTSEVGFLYRWGTGQVIGLAETRVHERKIEPEFRFNYR